MASEIDLDSTMRPLKASFGSFVTDVARTLREVEIAINDIQKGCEEENDASSEKLKNITLHIEQNIMRKITQLVEESKAITDTRI